MPDGDRDYRVYLEDVLGAISKIRRYTLGMSRESFAADDETINAVVRNREVIGEAVKQLPPNLRALHPGIEWQKIAGLRDILIHQHFGIDVDTLSSNKDSTRAGHRSARPEARGVPTRAQEA